MKKEVFAAALLVIILSATVANIFYLNNFTDSLVALVNTGCDAAEQGDWETATKTAEEAAAAWMDKDFYTHIVLQHSEIDSATDAFYDFLSAVYSADPSAAKGAGEKLVAHLTSISSKEKLSIGSIF